MPIRLNLLAEQQAEEEIRRRDPVKRALWVAGLLVACIGIWAAMLMFRGSGAAGELSAAEAALKKLDKEFKGASEDKKKITEVENKLHALNKLATNRFVWAPALDSLQRIAVTNIQITRLKVDQSYTLAAATVSADRKLPPKPATVTEKIILKLEARDYGTYTDQTYIQFKDRLLAEPYFKERLTKENAANFSGISQPVPDKDDPTKVYFTFTLECVFPEKVR